jgi:hypothetical protein
VIWNRKRDTECDQTPETATLFNLSGGFRVLSQTRQLQKHAQIWSGPDKSPVTSWPFRSAPCLKTGGSELLLPPCVLLALASCSKLCVQVRKVPSNLSVRWSGLRQCRNGNDADQQLALDKVTALFAPVKETTIFLCLRIPFNQLVWSIAVDPAVIFDISARRGQTDTRFVRQTRGRSGLA